MLNHLQRYDLSESYQLVHQWRQQDCLHCCDDLIIYLPVYSGAESEKRLVFWKLFVTTSCYWAVPVIGGYCRGRVVV